MSSRCWRISSVSAPSSAEITAARFAVFAVSRCSFCQTAGSRCRHYLPETVGYDARQDPHRRINITKGIVCQLDKCYYSMALIAMTFWATQLIPRQPDPVLRTVESRCAMTIVVRSRISASSAPLTLPLSRSAGRGRPHCVRIAASLDTKTRFVCSILASPWGRRLASNHSARDDGVIQRFVGSMHAFFTCTCRRACQL